MHYKLCYKSAGNGIKTMDKDKLEAMIKLGIAASKAGEKLRKVMLSMRNVQRCNQSHSESK